MTSSKNKNKLKLIGFLLGIFLVVYGGWGFWQRYKATHNPHPIIPSKVVTQSTDQPDETPLTDACAAYRVSANRPRVISIPSIGVSGCVQEVGIDQYNAVAVPTNIHLAGWYANSVLPGEKGVSVLDGHVSGRYSADAIFAELAKVKVGDAVKIELGDTSWRTFSVVEVSSYPINQVMEELFKPVESEGSQLTLITCGGVYDRTAQSYEQRVLVRAVLRT